MGKVLLVGCGKMGGAMLEGWLARGLAAADVDRRRAGRGAAAEKPGLRVVASSSAVRETPEIVVLAVKPQIMDAVLPDLKRFADAGRRVPVDRRRQDAALFRQPSRARRPRSCAPCPTRRRRCARASPWPAPRRAYRRPRRSAARSCSRRWARSLWVEDEALIDPVTALSGSGPAYVFLLVEAMAAAGAKLGLTPEMAMQLARATVAGSGELLRQSSEPASQLRVNVTSPGGTTAEALKVLMAADGIQPVFDKALAAPSRRSKELAG